MADFNSIPKTLEKKSVPKAEPTEKVDGTQKQIKPISEEISLKYSINIELPTTRDQLVYDAIFKSIKENLL